MSSIRPDSKADLVKSLRAVAAEALANAQAFSTYVESFDDFSEEEFAKHVGGEFSGAGFLFEIGQQMEKVTNPRDGIAQRAAKQALFEVGQHFARQSAKEA